MPTTSLLYAIASVTPLVLQVAPGNDAVSKLLVVNDIIVATSSSERYSQQRYGEASCCVDGVADVARGGMLVRIYELVMLLLDLVMVASWWIGGGGGGFLYKRWQWWRYQHRHRQMWCCPKDSS
ncbi:Hypothetical predicted protein [Olea europaea subsp. europaea]|uniref:Uncharacterized protein n=1 Tax=Olea europaea subsp. europaea TaxID=158383 RepID=A0A8S0REV7_OLEEU|nr:Hypothetical predicted protein [Olea europaea subsp. europaea]